MAGLPGCAWIDAQQRAKVYRPAAGTLADWKPITEHDEALWLDLPPTQAGAAPQRLRALWIPADDPAAPSGIVADSSGNIYIADNTNGRIAKSTPRPA